MFEKIFFYLDGGEKEANITKRLIYFITKEQLPYRIVDSDGFRIFMQGVAPLYDIPDRNKIKSLIKTKYLDISSQVREKLSTVDYATLTTDLWTDIKNSQSFIDLTVHFIKEQKHNSVTLGVKALHEQHTANNISSWLLEMLEEWNLTLDKIFSIVTDNARNITLAATNIFGFSKHMGCFAHKLNLVVSNTFSSSVLAQEIITKIKKIVAHFKH